MVDTEFAVNEELLDLISQCHKTVQNYISYLEKKITLQQKVIASFIENTAHSSVGVGTQVTEEECNETRQEDQSNEDISSTSLTAPISVLDDIKKLSEEASQFAERYLYEETSGLYYDTLSGYYYDAVRCLYYDGNGTYLTYNYETQAYEVAEVQDAQQERPKRKAKRRTKTKEDAHNDKENEDKTSDTETKEEGEISEASESESEDEPTHDSTPAAATPEYVEPAEVTPYHDFYRLALDQPPCIRIIVQKCSSNPEMAGSFFIVPYLGGDIGRGTQNLVSFDDDSLEDVQAKIMYEETEKVYKIENVSTSKMILNGKVVETDTLVHGSVLQVGSSSLLMHIHRGAETCGHCEPGLITIKMEEQKSEPKEVIPKASKHSQMRKEMKKIKEKYGIQKPITRVDIPEGYQDKAEARRKKHGIDYVNAKAETASVNEQINKSNKGFKMLSKMGWSSGEGIGKNPGISEPISVDGRTDTTGLGAAAMPAVQATAKQKRKRENLEITKQRFDKLPEQTKTTEKTTTSYD